MLNQCLESLVQKIQSGVVIKFEKTGPDPPPLEGKSLICSHLGPRAVPEHPATVCCAAIDWWSFSLLFYFCFLSFTNRSWIPLFQPRSQPVTGCQLLHLTATFCFTLLARRHILLNFQWCCLSEKSARVSVQMLRLKRRSLVCSLGIVVTS